MEPEATPRCTNVCGLKSSVLADGNLMEVTRPSGRKFLVHLRDGAYEAAEVGGPWSQAFGSLSALKRGLRQLS